jgi:hypothetical protein
MDVKLIFTQTSFNVPDLVKQSIRDTYCYKIVCICWLKF